MLICLSYNNFPDQMQTAVSEKPLHNSAVLAALQYQVTQFLCTAVTKATVIVIIRKKSSLSAKISLSPELVEVQCLVILRVSLDCTMGAEWTVV